MRRALAIFLLAMFGLAPISSALPASDPDSNLPACCRRAGQHHCAMTAGARWTSGVALKAGPCALFPVFKAGPLDRTSSLVAEMRGIQATLLRSLRLDLHVQTLALASYSRAGQKRGPPSLVI